MKSKREREKSEVKGECTHPYKRKIENAEECDGGVTTRMGSEGRIYFTRQKGLRLERYIIRIDILLLL